MSNDFLEDKREDCQKCSVYYNSAQRHAHTYKQFLQLTVLVRLGLFLKVKWNTRQSGWSLRSSRSIFKGVESTVRF